MKGRYYSKIDIQLPDLQLVRVVQEGAAPYRRVHCLPYPTLIYILPTSDRPAMGCLGAPTTHRSYQPFGTAIALPAHQPVHVFSPQSSGREMIILRYGEQQFSSLTGLSATVSPEQFERWSDIRSPALLRVLERLSVEMNMNDAAQEAMLAGLAMVALAELSRHLADACGEVESRGKLADWQLRRLEARIADPALSFPDVDELAGLCGISRRHLMRAYKLTTGSTVMEQVERARFERARLLLARGERVKAVAGSVGFTSQGSFATAFRRHCGISPRDFRQRSHAAMPGHMLSGLVG